MPQVAEYYEQVSARFCLSPSFVDSAPATLENRHRSEDFLNLLRRNAVPGDMLDPVQSPFEVVNSHALLENRAEWLFAALGYEAYSWPWFTRVNKKDRDHSRR